PDGRDTRSHGAAVQQHRTRAALALAAAVLGTGEVEVLAEHREQALRGIRLDAVQSAVDVDLEGRSHSSAPGGRVWGRRVAGRRAPPRDGSAVSQDRTWG